MTALLEQALQRVQTLSQEEQDAIASQILETLDEEAAWEQSLKRDPERLHAMAKKALDEHRRGETRPIEELFQ